jgi:nitrogen fixation NifU-like protein
MTDSIQTLTGDELRELYRAVILEHARKPRHFGSLDHPTHSAEGANPLCGDRLRLELAIDEAGIIRDVAFDGSGCAISLASASLLTDTVLGLNEAEAIGWFEDVTARLRGEPNNRELGPLTALEGVREFPVRVKCAALAWHALRSALSHADTAATTE